MSFPSSASLGAAVAVLGVLALTGCTGGSAAGDTHSVTVRATDTACELSASTAPSGTLTFDVTNAGSRVTEFYLLGADGQRVVGEVEDIGPGLSRKLTLDVPAGEYITVCKPGMSGEGLRSAFTVTGA